MDFSFPVLYASFSSRCSLAMTNGIFPIVRSGSRVGHLRHLNDSRHCKWLPIPFESIASDFLFCPSLIRLSRIRLHHTVLFLSSACSSIQSHLEQFCATETRGCSSLGRALALHARGTGIDARHLHFFPSCSFLSLLMIRNVRIDRTLFSSFSNLLSSRSVFATKEEEREREKYWL